MMIPYQWVDGYRLRPIHAGSEGLNWLFLPGGPGMGSEYLIDFTTQLSLPGNVYIADFPGDGSNCNVDVIDYALWKNGLLALIASLAPCVLVTHSFSGMFALTVPELEHRLAGLVVMSSAPDSGWLQELQHTKETYALPEIGGMLSQFYTYPTNENLALLFEENIPYLFLPHEIEAGQKILDVSQYNAKSRLWGDYHFHLTYHYQWYPQELPMLLVGSHDDRLLPMKLFTMQEAFVRDNIQILELEGTGHFPWLSCFDTMQQAFTDFAAQLYTA